MANRSSWGFLEEGATVHFCSRSLANVEAAQGQFSTTFPAASAIGTSAGVSEPKQIAAWVSQSCQCAEESGGIDVVVSSPSALSIPKRTESWQASVLTPDRHDGNVQLDRGAKPHLENQKARLSRYPRSFKGRDVNFSAPSPHGAIKAAQIDTT